MVDNSDKDGPEDKEDKYDAFTAEGEAVGYVSLDQARVLAIRHARDNTDFYGPRFADREMVWEVISAEEGEDYYDIRLSFQPARRFRGEPGVELFTVDKVGSIELKQIVSEPMPARSLRLPMIAGGLVVVVAAVVVGVLFVSGAFESNGAAAPPVAVVEPTATAPAASQAAILPISTPTAEPTLAPVPSPTPAPPAEPTATPVPQPTTGLTGELATAVKVAYRDQRYPTSWTHPDEVTLMAAQLRQRGFVIVNADVLQSYMKIHSSRGAASCVVILQGVVPDTVVDGLEPPSGNSLIMEYMRTGGRVVWIKDTPFFYVGTVEGEKVGVGDLGQQLLMGTEPDSVGADANEPVLITAAGTQWGLTQTWNSRRPTLRVGVSLAENPVSGGSAAYYKNLGGPSLSGFVRLWDGDDVFLSPQHFDDLDRICTFQGPVVEEPQTNGDEATVLVGRLLYNLDPITDFTQKTPVFEIKGRETLQACSEVDNRNLEPVFPEYDRSNGEFMLGLQPGSYCLWVLVDAAEPFNALPGYPGDFSSQSSWGEGFEVTVGQNRVINFDLSRFLRLVRPADNTVIPSFEGIRGGRFVSLESPVQISWDPVESAVRYDVNIGKCGLTSSCHGLASVYRESTRGTNVRVDLEVSEDGERYFLSLTAISGRGGAIGRLGVNDGGSWSGGLFFRVEAVVPTSPAATPTPVAARQPAYPADFQLAYSFRSGSGTVGRSFTIRVGPDSEGEITYRARLFAEEGPAWTESFAVVDVQLEKLYRLMLERNALRNEWDQRARALTGGGSRSIKLQADGSSYAVPSNLVSAESAVVSPVYEFIESIVPDTIWSKLESLQQQFVRENQ